MDIIADGQYIPKGTKIKIVKVEGFRILVEQGS
jgi:membrane-bound ClpP family serine protease